MKTNARLGGILAIIGALMGIIGHYVLFLNWYRIGMAADSAEPGCEILLKYIHPALHEKELGISFVRDGDNFSAVKQLVH
jgi:hypothetical protein